MAEEKIALRGLNALKAKYPNDLIFSNAGFAIGVVHCIIDAALNEMSTTAPAPQTEGEIERCAGDADRVITHDEAQESAQRLINSHFRKEPHARISIPSRPGYDDDLVICQYIRQQRAALRSAQAPARATESNEQAFQQGWDTGFKDAVVASGRTYADGIEDAAKQCALRADELAFDAANTDNSRDHRNCCREASIELACVATDIRALVTKPAGKEP